MISNTENKKTFPIFQQIKNIFPTVFVSLALSLCGAAVTVWVANETDNPIWKLAKDPAQVIGYPSYIGMLSLWSDLLWMASAVICFFSFALLKKHKQAFRSYTFFFASGILSLLLTIDDMFLLHDDVLPVLFDVREIFFYLIYILLLGIYIILYWKQISQYDYLLFIAAFILLAMSRGLFLPYRLFSEYKTINDMLKYFGIVFWLAFYYRAAIQEISGLLASRENKG